MSMFRKIRGKFQGEIQKLIKITQKILSIISLFFVYIIGIGSTAAVVKIFNRRILRNKTLDNNTFWIKAQGYDEEISKSTRQS